MGVLCILLTQARKRSVFSSLFAIIIQSILLTRDPIRHVNNVIHSHPLEVGLYKACRKGKNMKPQNKVNKINPMAPINILHMSVGHGDSGYDNNSLMQKIVIQKALPFLKHTIKGMSNHDVFLDHCFKIADLGCSYGTNTLLVATNIINIVTEMCKENNYKPPQFQVSLNDHFGNDFNSLFKLLPDFYAKLMKEKGENFGPCFVSAVPGSFYDRLFPDQSLHLVHSSYSIHWLSQAPERIENNALNIYVAKESPPNVFQEYAKQFYSDFTNFLKMRSKEIVCGGCMVLTLLGRSIADPTSDDACDLWEQLAKSLRDMLKEGLVRESDINSFNIPIYQPCMDEVTNIIQNEGSFSLDSSTFFQGNWDPQDTDYTNTKDLVELNHIHGRNTAKVVKAVIEPLLMSHFGNSIINTLFKKLEKYLAEHLTNRKTRFFSVVVSLIKK